jgi:hypothetical protein
MIDVAFPDNEDCPDCGGFIWRPGPRAGDLGQNIECVGCGSRFNIVRWDPAMRDPNYQGKLPIVWALLIENTGEWREDMFPKVLE